MLFRSLAYELGEPLVRGMDLYFRYAQELGLLSEIKPFDFFASPS